MNQNQIIMISYRIPIISIVILLSSCHNQERKLENSDNAPVLTNPKQEFAKLHKFLEKFNEPSQLFKTSSNKQIRITGKNGTIVQIDPADLETETGQTVGGNIETELKEISDQQQLLRANAQTISNGQLLVSGGAMFINVTSDGQKLKLKKGKTYSVAFPKSTEDKMKLYYGQRDSSNSMNWQSADQTFKSKKENKEPLRFAELVLEKSLSKDTLRSEIKKTSPKDNKILEKEAEINNKVYQPVELTQFGWINCDRLFDSNAPRTDLEFTIDNRIDDVNFVNVWLIFTKIKSVIQSSYYTYANKIEKENFKNIPIGSDVRIFAVSYQHHKIFALLSNAVKVKEHHNEKLILREWSESEFETLLHSIR